jgi:pyruvate/2-oxoglutarate dehydrogenase complex dihydrolipoamide dehydrogenase (E3) component
LAESGSASSRSTKSSLRRGWRQIRAAGGVAGRPMAEPLTPDTCVIGTDAGGLAVAAAAASFGLPTVLIETGAAGGESVKVPGPTSVRALLTAAERAHDVRNGARFGVKSGRTSVEFPIIDDNMREVMAALAPAAARERFVGLGVRVLKGEARFTDANTVAVDEVTIQARRFVIATGSSPVLPGISGLLDTTHFTTDSLAEMGERPRHLIIIGAGMAALELAQAFRRLGSKVTVLSAATPLANEDRECVAILLDALEREGITLRSRVEIAKVSRSFGKVYVVLATPAGSETIQGSHLLIALGRRPNMHGLDLEAAGIRYDEEGIAIDRTLRTSNKRVYAIGGVTDGPKSDNLGPYHATLVIRHALFQLPVKVNHDSVARVAFTDPEFAQVGLHEDEARARHRVIRVLRWPFRANERALADRSTEGHVKAITDRNGNVLGATIVGPQAGEGIAIWTLAVAEKLNVRALASLPVPHPSYGEMAKDAALAYFTRSLTSAGVRRIIGWLRR